MVVAQICGHTTIHWIMYLNWVDFILCKLYFNKTVIIEMSAFPGKSGFGITDTVFLTIILLSRLLSVEYSDFSYWKKKSILDPVILQIAWNVRLVLLNNRC